MPTDEPVNGGCALSTEDAFEPEGTSTSLGSMADDIHGGTTAGHNIVLG